MRHHLSTSPDGYQLDEGGLKLYQAILCSPRMAIASPYLESKFAIDVGSLVEVPDCDDKVIDSAHPGSLPFRLNEPGPTAA